VHVLIDLQGPTYGGRPEIAAMRPAPVVALYLIFPGTSGAVGATDYQIVDRAVAPPEHAPYFTEKLVYLRGSYQVNYYARHLALLAEAAAAAPPPARGTAAVRAAHGLPGEGFVYCNFNKQDKLEPAAWRTWMALLRAAPRSVLWLLHPSEKHADIAANLRLEAAAAGVAPSRLVFAARVPKHAHLQRHAACDLFVDTFEYGAHSTATDALRGGAPLLSRVGRSFPQRVGKSLAEALPGSAAAALLTHHSMEFEAVGAALAARKGALDGARRRLAAETGGLLFDTERFTRGFERAAEAMFEVSGGGQGPMHVVM